MFSDRVNVPCFEDEGGTVVVLVQCAGSPQRLHFTTQELKMSQLPQSAVSPETQCKMYKIKGRGNNLAAAFIDVFWDMTIGHIYTLEITYDKPI